MESDGELVHEMKYLNKNEKIRIRDIVVKHSIKEAIHEYGDGIRIHLKLLSKECKDELKDYVEEIYEELNEYREKNCDPDINTNKFSFSKDEDEKYK